MGKKRNYGASEDSPDACFGALGSFMNTGNDPSTMSTGEFVPGWHRGADLTYATHSEGGLVHCNFVKALSNLTELTQEDDGGTVVGLHCPY